MSTAVSKIRQHGGSVCCYFPQIILRAVALKRGDAVALRTEGRCIVIERIEMEELARLRRDTLRAQSAPDGRGNE